jgi:hypothetical protein
LILTDRKEKIVVGTVNSSEHISSLHLVNQKSGGEKKDTKNQSIDERHSRQKQFNTYLSAFGTPHKKR